MFINLNIKKVCLLSIYKFSTTKTKRNDRGERERAGVGIKFLTWCNSNKEMMKSLIRSGECDFNKKRN